MNKLISKHTIAAGVGGYIGVNLAVVATSYFFKDPAKPPPQVVAVALAVVGSVLGAGGAMALVR